LLVLDLRIDVVDEAQSDVFLDINAVPILGALWPVSTERDFPRRRPILVVMLKVRNMPSQPVKPPGIEIVAVRRKL